MSLLLIEIAIIIVFSSPFLRLFFVAFRTNFIAIKKKTTRTACAALFILVVFLLLLKCAKRKAKFYFIPIQKKKRKNLEKLSTTSRFFLLFNINVCIFIQIHLMLLLIYLRYFDNDLIDINSNTSYVIINQQLQFLVDYRHIHSNTSYVIINHI